MITLEIEDVYSPVGPCDNCGEDLFLEPSEDRRREFEAKCWACGNSRAIDLDFQENYVRRLYPQVQTWRINRPSREFPDGLVIFGEKLFVTTDIKRKVTEELDGSTIPKSYRLNLERLLQEIEEREETIEFYLQARQIEDAYHFAAARHQCGIKDGHSPPTCREMVNWISVDPAGLYGEHFNIYGLIIKSWKICCQRIRYREIDVQNETEIRCRFVQVFESLDENPYEIWFGMDREIYVDNERLKPDAQIPALVVIEIKSFFSEQEYNCSQAVSLVADDLRKLEKYKGKFKVGFFLCFSHKFSKDKLMENISSSFSYPVRVLMEEG